MPSSHGYVVGTEGLCELLTQSSVVSRLLVLRSNIDKEELEVLSHGAKEDTLEVAEEYSVGVA